MEMRRLLVGLLGILLLARSVEAADAPPPVACDAQMTVALKLVESARAMRDYYEAQLAQAQVDLAALRTQLKAMKPAPTPEPPR